MENSNFGCQGPGWGPAKEQEEGGRPTLPQGQQESSQVVSSPLWSLGLFRQTPDAEEGNPCDGGGWVRCLLCSKRWARLCQLTVKQGKAECGHQAGTSWTRVRGGRGVHLP